MTNALIGMFLLLFVMAATAGSGLALYNMYSQNRPTSDTYGDAFKNKTNTSIAVENSVAPAMLLVNGYIAVMVAIFIVIGSVLMLAVFILGGGSNVTRR